MVKRKNLSEKIIRDELLHHLLIIFAVAAIAYLPFINQFGFYRDDWYVIWATTTQGFSTLIKMFSIDRPFWGLLFVISGKVLGGNLLGWQISAFVFRVACSFIFFWIVRMLWPEQKIPALLMTIIFTIYPGFQQQPNANTFQNIFISYGFCLFSIALSIKAFLCKGRNQKIVLTILAILSGLMYLFILEYVIGMELVRIGLLFLLIRRAAPDIKFNSAVRKTFLQWLPYLVMLLAFLFWRLIVFKGARASTDINALIPLYLQNPLGTTLTFINEGIFGVVNSVFFAWAVPLYNLAKSLSAVEFMTGLLVSLAVGFGVYYYLSKRPIVDIQLKWKKQVTIIGIFSVIATVMPVVLLNRNIRLDNVFNRYTIPSTFAIALFIAGSIYLLIKNQKMIHLIFSVLIVIAIFTQFSNGVYYKKLWDVQRSVWWQLSWRAPNIKDNTTLVVFTPQAYRLEGPYEIWGPANIIYHPEPGPLKITGVIPNFENLPLMLFQQTVGREVRRVDYIVDFKQMLVLSLPSSSVCMHVIDGSKSELSDSEEAAVRMLHPFSKVSLISTEGENHQPPVEVFGPEPVHDWCYFYQKASLARQREDWQEIINLGEEVKKLGLQPKDLSEWMPFYEGFAKGHRIDLANEVGALIRTDQTFIWQFCGAYKNTDWSKEDKMDTYFVTNICGV